MYRLVALLFLSTALAYVFELSPASPKNDCDSVGTHFVQSFEWGKRCICNRPFYGDRCEKILRCVSGRAANVTCGHAPHMFEQQALDRCVEGQDLLEVCVCFHGYTGVVCQMRERATLRLPSVPNHREQGSREEGWGEQQMRRWEQANQWDNYEQRWRIEQEEEHKWSPLVEVTGLLIAMSFFLLILSCCVAVTRRHTTRAASFWRRGTTSTYYGNAGSPKHIEDLPPSYHDAVINIQPSRSVTAHTAAPPSTSTAPAPSSSTAPAPFTSTVPSTSPPSEDEVVIVERKLFSHV